MDREESKKIHEEIALDFIRRAYQAVAGETFEDIRPSETPDFLASDSKGRTVGIELTRLKFSPDEMWARQVMRRDQWADDNDSAWRLLGLLHAKGLKLQSGSWPGCQRKILFVQVEDSTLERLGPFEIDVAEAGGFDEVWLADFTILKEQGSVFLQPIVHPLGSRLAWQPQERGKPFG